jgi:hypothetical protein
VSPSIDELKGRPAAEVIKAIPDFNRTQLEALKRREESTNAPRKSVIAALDKAIEEKGGSAESAEDAETQSEEDLTEKATQAAADSRDEQAQEAHDKAVEGSDEQPATAQEQGDAAVLAGAAPPEESLGEIADTGDDEDLYRRPRAEVLTREGRPPEEVIDRYLDHEETYEPAVNRLTVPTETVIALADQVDKTADEAKQEIEDRKKNAKEVQEAIEAAQSAEPTTWREAAEIHSNFPEHTFDPAQAFTVESSNVDDFAQRVDAANAAAAPLRAEAAAREIGHYDELSSSQHQRNAILADSGDLVGAAEGPTRAENIAQMREADTKRLEKDESKWVRLLSKLEDHHQLSPIHREDTPDPPQHYLLVDPWVGPELAAANLSMPQESGIAPGDAVSRLDDSHPFLGVVVGYEGEPGSQHRLLKVIFPKDALQEGESEEQYFAPNNVRFEGKLEDLVARQEELQTA